MKIGKFVKNSEGIVEEVAETTSYGNWAEAETAARILKNDNANNDDVCGIFLGVETSPDTYVIKSII
jgi:hypothetical protein